MSRAVFLDRDGVINRKAPEGQYVTRWEEMQFLPQVAEAIALLKGAGFLVIVVSNQRCVARGLITPAALETLHQRMRAELTEAGATIDAIYYCPHDLQPQCNCRKPSPGMLLAAAQVHDIELSRSWMVGDSDVDVKAGKSAGCKTALVRSTVTDADNGADLVAASLFDAAQQILRWSEMTSRPCGANPQSPAGMAPLRG
jgi:D-glycero-D-manno-heptose 1,7-bisphosphate phosphatase